MGARSSLRKERWPVIERRPTQYRAGTLAEGRAGLIRHTDSDARMERHPQAQEFSKLVCFGGFTGLARGLDF